MNIEEPLPEMIEPNENDPRIQAALTELREMILQRFPSATFRVFHGEDPDGIHLVPIVDVEDLDEVSDIVLIREVAMQVEGGLPVYVFPDWPIERVQQHLRTKTVDPVEKRLALLGL